jgi:hypothetical protein
MRVKVVKRISLTSYMVPQIAGGGDGGYGRRVVIDEGGRSRDTWMAIYQYGGDEPKRT